MPALSSADLPSSDRAHPRATLLTIARLPRAILGVALMVALTSLYVGFTSDDYGFRIALRSGLRASFDLFRFGSGRVDENLGLIASGTFPWWMAPDFKLHFIRPLASLVFACDFILFGDHASGYHIHSIIWYLGLLVAVSQIFKRVLPRSTAAIALLVFALSHAHVLPYTWICAQHVLVGAVPATFALLAHLRATRENWRPGRVLSPLLFAVGLLGSETALAIVPFWIAHDLMLMRARASAGPRQGLLGDWRRSLHEVAPVGVISAIYLVLYRIIGGGTHSAEGYLDPFADPGAFIGAMTTRLPTLVADALLGFSAEGPAPAWVHVGLGIGASVLCGALLLRSNRRLSADERSALAWLLPGALGATCLAAASGSARLLLVPDLGFCALLGVIIRHGFDGVGGSAVMRAARITAVAGLAVAHLLVAPAQAINQIQNVAWLARADEAIAGGAELGAKQGQRVFLLASENPKVFFYPKTILEDRRPGLVSCWSVLSAAASPHRVTRVDDRSLLVETTGRPVADGYRAQYFSSRRFVAGDEIRQCGATVRVDAVDGGTPSRLRVDLDEALESGDLTFLTWQDGRLRHFVMPVVGESVDVPWGPTVTRVSRIGRLVASVKVVSDRLWNRLSR
jgi:hypothetical protein